MSEIKITKVLPSTITTPDLGRATLFFDSDSNSLALRDDNSDLLPVGGGGFGSTVLDENVDILGSFTPGQSKVVFGYDNTNIVGPWWNDQNEAAVTSFEAYVDYRNYTGGSVDSYGGTMIGSYFPVGTGIFEAYRAFVYTDPGTAVMQSISNVGGVFEQGVIRAGSNSINLQSDYDAGSVDFQIASLGACVFDDNRLIRTGIEYGGNYHTEYTNRSLVDKEYVDNGVKKVVATTANTTTDFSNVVAGDFVVHIPATPGNAEFGVAPGNGTSPFPAVVGDLYISFRP